MRKPSTEDMLAREAVANRPKHWVRAVTACNSKCIFCLDSDTPRNLYLPEEAVKAELDRGLDELGAEKVIISGGEASLHPKFPEFIRYALERGYDRVQTVTNGYRFAEKDFYDTCIEAGLGEITFSLHGHTAELHDRLTQTPNGFDRLIKGMIRAVRDPRPSRPIVNVDVVINKQNVGVLDKIIELCLRLGVSEFDLLHVIPQAAAFDHRDQLFYDPTDHLPMLHKVFRLNRHRGVTVWTNRFPVTFLEGMEDLIQDPHKMLDEINGRRFMVRSYLDTGDPLACRQPERCIHCFIEPLCTTMDRFIADVRNDQWDVWWADGPVPESLPFGCTRVGGRVAQLTDPVARPEGAGLYLEVDTADALPDQDWSDVTLVAEAAAQLDAWLPLPAGASLEVRLNRDTAPWVQAHAAELSALGDRALIHQPSYEKMEQTQTDVRNPRELFGALEQRLRVSGLPACLAPGMQLEPEPRVLRDALFDPETGRPVIRELARFHVSQKYRSKSLRCGDCVVADRCEGAGINMIRDQGLGLMTPLIEGPEADEALKQVLRLHPEPLDSLATGKPPEAVAPSLPGFAQPTESAPDPLSVFAKQRADKRKHKRPSVGSI